MKNLGPIFGPKFILIELTPRSRADKKSQATFGFLYTTDFWSSVAYESGEKSQTLPNLRDFLSAQKLNLNLFPMSGDGRNLNQESA